MTVIDMHPEELFDREAAGTLSSDERQRLDDHLARCSVCRFERQLRRDFDEELNGRRDSLALATMLAGALEAAQPGAQPELATQEPEPLRSAALTAEPARRLAQPARSFGARRLVLVLAAALVFGSGLAAAQSTDVARALAASFGGWFAQVDGMDGGAPDASAKPARAAACATAAELAPASASVASGVDAPSPSASVEAASSSFAVHAPSAHGAPPAVTAAVAVVPAASVPAPEPADAAGWFAKASAARRAGRGAEAMAAYAELQRRFPASSEALVATAIVARSQLDSGNAAAALSGFERYLGSGHGALRAEAMGGRALALGRLGRRGEELDAWRAVLAAYPTSGYAALARERLEQGE